MVINIAGVEASPQSSTVTPAAVRAAVTASRRRGPEIRLSRPTDTVSLSAGFPARSESQAANPAAMACTASSVKSSGSPATPSTATPRMSVPLLKCFQSAFNIDVLSFRFRAAFPLPRLLPPIIPFPCGFVICIFRRKGGPAQGECKFCPAIGFYFSFRRFPRRQGGETGHTILRTAKKRQPQKGVPHMADIIRIQNMYKIYNPGPGEVRALDGVSLTVEEGAFVAIVGQSGSGKSTLMNMLGCLDSPTEGEYWLEGKNVAHLSDRELSDIRNLHIGFIFQGFHLIPSLDALENVELPLLYRGMPRDERRRIAAESLARVGLGERLRHRPAEMSGGQQQRVAIARAIAAHPPIIMADEPTGALDSKTGRQVLEILHSLHEDGSTIILITHDNGIAATAERIVRLSDGHIIADGSREEVGL